MEAKLPHSRQLIARGLEMSRRPTISWSGGKDSTAMLYLVREQCPSVDVIYNDPGVDLPETYEFVEGLANEWNLNLHISKPPRGRDFWSIGRQAGWPIFGKSVCSNVERARRTGNLRHQLSALERELVFSNLKLSCSCADRLRGLPCRELESGLGCDLKFVGLRADESRARVRLWADHGELFYVKRYYSSKSGIWKLNPIARWTEADVWDFTASRRIPHCRLYDMGHTRNGCWTCAMAIRNGQLSRLQTSHPELFEELVVHSPMAVELMRAHDFWCGRPVRQRYTKADRKSRLDCISRDMACGWRRAPSVILTQGG